MCGCAKHGSSDSNVECTCLCDQPGHRGPITEGVLLYPKLANRTSHIIVSSTTEGMVGVQNHEFFGVETDYLEWKNGDIMIDLTLEEFLQERLLETQRYIHHASVTGELNVVVAARVEHAIDAQLALIEWHKNFPVLVQSKPEFDRPMTDEADFGAMAKEVSYRLTQKMDLWTRDQYLQRIGHWPPALQLMKEWAKQYDKHPNYNPEW